MTGSNLLIQPNPSQKLRQNLAQSMMGQSISGQPVGHWTQALARIVSAAAGKSMMSDIEEDRSNRMSGAQDTLTQALAGYRGDTTHNYNVEAPGPVQPGGSVPYTQEQVMVPGNQQNMGELTRILAGNPDTAHLANNLQMAEISAGMKPDNAIQEVYDPNSPTGTRFVRKTNAVGMPGKPGSGMDIQFGDDGRVIGISTGRGKPGGGGLTKATTNKVQEKALNAQEAMARLDNVNQLYEPRFQQVPTRLGMQWTALKSKWDAGEVAAEDMQDLYDYSMYRSTAIGHLNLVLKELSGAAVNEHEMVRLKAELPNAGSGVFDGDDPITFQSKMDRAMQDTKRAIVRYHYMQGQGKDPLSMPLWKIDDVINQRGAELEQLYGNTPDSQQRIQQQLKQEFLI